MTKTIKKEEWEELIRSDFFLYNVSVPLLSIPYSNEFLGGPKYRKLLLYIKGREARYYENFADHYIVGEYCLRRFLEEKNLFSDYIRFWHSEFRKFENLIDQIRNTDLNSLSLKQLADLLEKLHKKSIYWHGITYNVDAIDATLSPLIEKTISESHPGEKKSRLSEIYNRITFPDVLSYMNRMNLEKLKLIIESKKYGIEESKKKIRDFIERYYWINFKWGESEEYTEEYLKKEIEDAEPEEKEKELNDTEERIRKNLEEKKKTLKQISEKQPIINDYIRIFDEYSVLHDKRKEGQVKAVYYIRKIYNSIAVMMKERAEILYYLWPMELVEIIRGNAELDKELIDKRSKEWFCEYYETGDSREYYGKEAAEKRDEAIGIDIDHHQKELSGVGASQGRITGKARVCLDADSAIRDIKKGEILVTGMTMPEFVPAMEKAGAIVTDEGGLTCHAAIISREFGKPCVVGTKMATRIINNGDEVEVNANHGVVKIIR